MIKFMKRYRYAIPIIVYMIVYLLWFFIIEKRPVDNYTIIHMSWDDKIPFCEYFIIPYMCWFGYVAAAVMFMVFFDRDEYCKLFTTLTIGMTAFLIISTFWPNAHELRPNIEELGRSNFFTVLIGNLYRTDTCTNLIPSIHVYNSIMVEVAILHSTVSRKIILLRFISLILCVSIIMSTVLIKQHSLIDVFCGFGLALIVVLIVYVGRLNFFQCTPLKKLIKD